MMGRPFTIVGAIVAVVALGAFLLLSARGGAGGSAAAPPANLKPVVVAARDVATRIPLTAADVKVVRMELTAIPPQAFATVDLVKGLIPVVGIAKDQPVTSNLLVASSDQVTGAQAAFLPIPKGYVAKTVPTSEQQGVAGYIQPGDYIAVEAFVTPPGGYANTNERTIFTNVHVLRAGPAATTVAAVGKATPAATTSSGATSLTLIVTQCQAEIIDWFIANAAIKYTLESYRDYSPKDLAVDNSCPNVDAAGGVTKAVIQQKYPGLAP